MSDYKYERYAVPDLFSLYLSDSNLTEHFKLVDQYEFGKTAHNTWFMEYISKACWAIRSNFEYNCIVSALYIVTI